MLKFSRTAKWTLGLALVFFYFFLASSQSLQTAFRESFWTLVLISLPLLAIVCLLAGFAFAVVLLRSKLDGLLEFERSKLAVALVIGLLAFTLGASKNVSCGRFCIALAGVSCDVSGTKADLFVWQDDQICPVGEFPETRYELNQFFWLIGNSNSFLSLLPVFFLYWYFLACWLVFFAREFQRVRVTR